MRYQRLIWGFRPVLGILLLLLLFPALPLKYPTLAQAPWVRVIVQFDIPTLGESPAASEEAYTATLRDQSRILHAILSAIPEAKVEAQFALLWRGVSLRVPASEQLLARLREIPGVKAVYPEIEFFPALYDSLEVISAPSAWEQVGGQANAGMGIRVAVLDSGIALDHPMFDPTGLAYPPGYPKGWAAFTSPKVIAARAYFRPTDPPLPGEDTPVPGGAGSYHGTHAAGIIAGVPVTVTLYGTTRTLSGVAPGAYLMNYRIFYPAASDGLERAYTTEILRALEDAVRDGAQVIYNGWSGHPATAYAASPVVQSLQAAVAAGVVVIAPAGNEGPAYATASRLPGGVEGVLTVGAQGTPYGRALFGPTIEAVLGPYSIRAVSQVAPDASPLACAPLPAGSLEGFAALIERGGCPFATKVYHAQEAGAVLAVIINTTDAVSDMACIGDYCNPGEITIPSAMVAKGFGNQLVAWLAAPGASPSITLDPVGRVVSSSPQVIAPTSGRGPAFMRLLKPDITAPGVAVVSAGRTSGTLGPFAAGTGSSVAAAHAAGAAAVLLQAHPNWRPSEVKAAMMATARLAEDPEGLPVLTSVLDRGAGLLDLARAVTTTLLFEPPSLSLPMLLASSSGEVTFSVRDLRTSGDPLTWDLEVVAKAGLVITAPLQVATSAGGTTLLTLTYHVAADIEGDVEAMISLIGQGDESYRLPLWGYVHGSPGEATVLVIDNDVEFAGGGIDTLPAIEAALDQIGVSYDVWNADAFWGAEQTLPDLEVLARYPVILWTAGQKRNPDGTFIYRTPLTACDQQLLMSYLDGGGRLLAMGQNMADATDISPDPDPVWGRSALYHGYLGAHWLQDNVFATKPPAEALSVVGLPGTFLRNVALDLGDIGSGAGHQDSIDELGIGGDPGGYDAALVQPVAAALSGAAVGEGYVMLAKADEPTLERPSPRIPYRVLYQSFGLEGINTYPGATSPTSLLRRQLDWLLDEISVSVGEDWAGGPFTPTMLRAEAASSVGASMQRYRWHLEGNGIEYLAESADPTIYVSLDHVGVYTATVEATDELGHKGIGSGTVRILPGGASTLSVNRVRAAPGESLLYTLSLRNTSAESIVISSTLFLPAHTTYLSHTGEGAQWQGGRLMWQGSLEGGETRLLTLTVLIDPHLIPPANILAEASFEVEGQTFERQARTSVTAEHYRYLPLALK